MAHYLVGVSGDMMTVIRQRPDPQDHARLLPVENKDQASALLRFKNGAHGYLRRRVLRVAVRWG